MSASATPLTTQDVVRLTEQQHAQIALLERMLFQALKEKDALFLWLLFALRRGPLTVPRADIDALLLDQYRIDVQDEIDSPDIHVRLLHINDPASN